MTVTAAVGAEAASVRPPSPRRRRSRPPGARGEALAAYGFLAPNLVLLAVFVLVPLVGAFGVSLTDAGGFGQGGFVGLGNYAELFADPTFWRALGNTILFTVLVTPLSMLLGLVCAVLLNTSLPARPLWRSLLILPMAVSGIATGLMGVLIFDQNSGIVNRVVQSLNAALSSTGLALLHLPVLNWQSDPAPAFATIVVATVWWRTGFNMLIYLAGLQGIGPDLMEAARLDGANAMQRFWNVTVPLLGPTSFFLVVLNVIYSFQVFDIVFVLTGGGPGGATDVFVTYAYDTGFVTGRQGYAAAIGMVLMVFALGFAAAQWRASRTRDLAE